MDAQRTLDTVTALSTQLEVLANKARAERETARRTLNEATAEKEARLAVERFEAAATPIRAKLHALAETTRQTLTERFTPEARDARVLATLKTGDLPRLAMLGDVLRGATPETFAETARVAADSGDFPLAALLRRVASSREDFTLDQQRAIHAATADVPAPFEEQRTEAAYRKAVEVAELAEVHMHAGRSDFLNPDVKLAAARRAAV